VYILSFFQFTAGKLQAGFCVKLRDLRLMLKITHLWLNSMDATLNEVLFLIDMLSICEGSRYFIFHLVWLAPAKIKRHNHGLNMIDFLT